jgi:hypothetical protein
MDYLSPNATDIVAAHNSRGGDRIVVWKMNVANPRYASVRYRCLMPMMDLYKTGIQSIVMEKDDDIVDFDRVSALIFMKAFTMHDVDLARRAKSANVPVFFDICDNIFIEEYGGDLNQEVQRNFLSISELATGIVTTGPAMVEQLRKELPNGLPIWIVPDQVELQSVTTRLLERPTWDADPYGIRVRKQNVDPVFGRLLLGLRRLPFLSGHAKHLLHMRRLLAGIIAPTKLYWFNGLVSVSLSVVMRVVGLARQGKIRNLSGMLWRRGSRSSVKAYRLLVKAARWSTIGGISARLLQQASWRLRSFSFSFLRRIYWLLPGRLRNTFIGRSLRDPQSLVAGFRRGLASAARGLGLSADGVEEVSPRKTVIWFGHHGSNHGRYGLIVLADLIPQLKAIDRQIPIRLLVVSDDQKKFERLFAGIGFPAEFRQWNPLRIFDDIRSADVCLVPNSKDLFSITKSANRAVLALSLGVPVVATRVPSTEPLEGSVIFDDWVGGVLHYLSDREAVNTHLITAAQIIEKEYSGRAIGQIWSRILGVHSARLGSARQSENVQSLDTQAGAFCALS